MVAWRNIAYPYGLLALIELSGCASLATDLDFVGPPAPSTLVERVAFAQESDKDDTESAHDEGESSVSEVATVRDTDDDHEDFADLEGDDTEADDESTTSAEPADADLEIAEELVQVDDPEDGFCSDDIYAQYLMDRYRLDNDGKSTLVAPSSKSHRKTARSRRRRHDDMRYFRNHSRFAALASAHSVMVGPTSPYMGAIPIVVNDKVDFWIHYFKTSGRGMFMRWLVRGESIKPLVQPILQDSGVPMEFFYLAMIESGLSNSANSRARAMGTWQFMRGTAKLYGLKINHWVDERRDPLKSTVAAARYLKELYSELGDWYLAMAAYNAGPGRVRRAMRLSGSTDFWKLCETRDLAKETKEYVPKVLAAVLLAADPEAHGFNVQATETPEVADTTVTIRKPVRLDELASRLGVSLKTLRSWNPELLRNMTPPVHGGYALRLSSNYLNRYEQLAPRLTEASVQGLGVHTVRSGDTFSHIAHKYGIEVRQLMELNPEIAVNKLKPGSSVVVPSAATVSTSSSASRRGVL